MPTPVDSASPASGRRRSSSERPPAQGGTVLDWLATGATVSGVFAALISFDALQRVALRLGPHAHMRAVAGMARGINRATLFAGARRRCEGLENVDPQQNYIVVSNHQSLLDVSQASEYLAALEPRFVSKIELAHGVPGVSYNLKHGGSACIDRHDPKQARAAIEELARHVREDHYTVVLYPEGTRSHDGRMHPWKTGGLRTLLTGAPGVPVLPVTSSGGSLLFQNDMKPLVRGVSLVFRIHPPIEPPTPLDDASFDDFMHRCAATIEGALPTPTGG